jgi:asparagine synthase (glutamine-hydrolysing)
MKVPVRMKLDNLGEVIKLNENEPAPKTDKYFQKTKDGKLILRKTMKKYIPEQITGAIKQGFSAPDASWFKGESIDYVRRMLLKGDPLIYEYMDRKAVQELVDDHLSGRQNRRLFIWSLLNFEYICKEYF